MCVCTYVYVRMYVCMFNKYVCMCGLCKLSITSPPRTLVICMIIHIHVLMYVYKYVCMYVCMFEGELQMAGQHSEGLCGPASGGQSRWQCVRFRADRY